MRAALAIVVGVLCAGCGAIDNFSPFHVVGADQSAELPDLATPDLTDIALVEDLTVSTDFLNPQDLPVATDLAVGPDLAFPSGPSCVGLASTCGPNGNESCCENLIVPGGMFFRSYDATADYGDKSNPAMVSDFRLDKYEVTVGRFRTMISIAGPGTQTMPPPNGSGASLMAGTGWDPNWNGQLAVDINQLKAELKCDAKYQTWTDAQGGNENLPINCVDWYDAFAFCVWDGGRLPTEAEWNYAAAAGGEQRA